MDTDDFCRLERERTQALVSRDLETIERLHAPDYELITWQAVWSQATQAPDAGGAPSLTAPAALRL